jgi:hypothetical protein
LKISWTITAIGMCGQTNTYLPAFDGNAPCLFRQQRNLHKCIKVRMFFPLLLGSIVL